MTVDGMTKRNLQEGIWQIHCYSLNQVHGIRVRADDL